jgi:hypothetical protein
MPDSTPRGDCDSAGLQAAPAEKDAAKAVARQQREAEPASGSSDAGVLMLTNLGGTGDAITADLPPSSGDPGIDATCSVWPIGYVPLAENTRENPTLTIGGASHAVRGPEGEAWPAGAFVTGRCYHLLQWHGELRVVADRASPAGPQSRVWHTSEKCFALLTPPPDADQIRMPGATGPMTWLRLVCAPQTGDPRVHAPSADGCWWWLGASGTPTAAGQILAIVQDSLSPAGQTAIPPDATTLLVRRDNGGQELRIWRPAHRREIPADGTDSTRMVRDGTGRWWALIFDAAAPAKPARFHVHVRNTLSPSAEAIPPAATTLMLRRNNGPGATLWRPATGAEIPGDEFETAITVRDATGRWWTQIFDAQGCGWPILASRAEAIARLPGLASRGCTLAMALEGGRMVLRSKDAATGALFDDPPRWGLAWDSDPGAPDQGAALFLPGRPDYEREHLPDYADPVFQALPGVAAGMGASPSLALTDMDFTADWFLTAQACTSDLRHAAVKTVPGYEPTDHVIHPCIMEMYDSFRGFRYVMAITAFPNRTDQKEDPFLFGSNDGLDWVLFPDMPQPLAQTPNAWSYNSDVWLSQDPRTGELYVCWREFHLPDAEAVGMPARQETRLKFRATRDGVNWSEPHTFLTLADHAANVSPISPSILFDPASLTWHMWAVQRPNLGHWTASSIYGPWTCQGTFAISSPSASRPRPPHHLEVKCVGNQIIAMVGHRWTGDQYLARLSFDAPRTWTWAQTSCLLGNGDTEAANNRYKATFLPRIKPDGTMRLGIWWTGGGRTTLSLRYAESRQAFTIAGWGKAAPGTALSDLAALDGGYGARLLTPMGKPATLVERTRIRAVFPCANTASNVTLAVNGTCFALLARLGRPLEAGDLQPGCEYELELRRTSGQAICLDIIR